jgi:hypothetical protein
MKVTITVLYPLTTTDDKDFSMETVATRFLQNTVIPEATKIFTDESQKGENRRGINRNVKRIENFFCSIL